MESKHNVDALADLLQLAWSQPWKLRADGPTPVEIAQFLASRGVLVISDAVLTDEALRQIVPAESWVPDSVKWDLGDGIRAALSRIAKGETP